MGAAEYGQLLDAHGAALVLYARQWCATPEDVVQTAFIKLISQPTPPVNCIAWLYRVVRNAALSAQRDARRRRTHEEQSVALSVPWFESGADTQLDAQTATEALQTLPPEEREVVVAHLWGGLTFAQVAEVVGCSDSTAHRRYREGLERLRARLKVPCTPTDPLKNRSAP